MVKRFLSILVLLVFTLSLSGCATARKQREMEMQGLKNQISVLETQLQSKDEEISNLRDALNKAAEEKEVATKLHSRKKIIGEVKSRPNIKQIQAALRNAGYNPGPVDGKPGKQTRDAIKSFQRANDLPADGKVGKRTWALLKDYLYKKVK